MSRIAFCFGAVAATAAENNELSSRFVTIGDWGCKVNGTGSGLNGWKTPIVAGAAAAHSPAFVIGAGDNFYHSGCYGASDGHFTRYRIPHDKLPVTWYNIVGNHDYGMTNSVENQIAYHGRHGWYLPSRYYTFRQNMGTGGYATFIMLDTNICIQEYRSTDRTCWGPPTDAFGPEITKYTCKAQAAWVKEQVAKVPVGDWLIAVGHHDADFRSFDSSTSDLHRLLDPLIARGLDLYINGHYHKLGQYKSYDGSDAYVVSGAGCEAPMVDSVTAVINEPVDESVDDDEPCKHGPDYTFKEYTAGYTMHKFESATKLKTFFYKVDKAGNEQSIHTFTVTKRSAIAWMASASEEVV